MKKQTIFKKAALSIAAVALLAPFMPHIDKSGLTSNKAEAAATFPDIKDFKAEIDYLTGFEIIRGYPDGTFRPTASITRLDAVRMILREMEIVNPEAANPGFADMNSKMEGFAEVAKAVEIGFIDGKKTRDGKKVFDPKGQLTRAEMAKILTEAYALDANNKVEFVDVNMGHWANAYISRLATAKVTVGYPGGYFRPESSLERQHFAAFMARLLNPAKFQAGPVVIPPPKYPAPPTNTPGKYVDGILVVNKVYALPSTYNPGIIPVAQQGVNAMVSAAKSNGVYLSVISSYRSYSYQSTLYNNYVKRDGQAAADRYSARPGHSEHQTGLAFDFGGTNQNHWLESSFADTSEGKWLAANAHKYGFILRYPKGKESITGYMFEPWHFRYVGSGEAPKIKESGKTLEEYLNVRGS
ncbi:D-alanyl-D-alanine carboxypeptidase family protein [Planococcus halotolerans]|uniref:Peptidase M15 n=1 Tax=Planococcus halotolerans TaxID=2233542 RepID=A0A365L2F4_9BACL|nr:D-alanyl-D-alanine carboxypeptidase family protein [Planococcus halotolerans]QHJ70634.1 peptidase M15 [Planococcus halotolerans]RAZ79608.1 peptidase M15 [Planococcus halotolerans]